MIGSLSRLASRSLFALDPETAHGVSIAALSSGLAPPSRVPSDPRLVVRVAGLDFPNPVGLAAGYDKNAQVPDAALRLGFGFVEVGTVTPLPQAGNARPRIFRLTADHAVINRLGFNNEGHAAALARLSARAGRPGLVGVNIGANKDSADRIADYVAGVRAFAAQAAYLTVNVSSPNTPGLRALQARESLAELLAAVLAARDETPGPAGRKTPVLLKIAPDLSEEELDDVAAELVDKRVDGAIVSNTTLSRDGLRDAARTESGGLSGRPLFVRSTAVLARMRRRLGADFPLIGVGGVEDGETAAEKIRAGADLVQLYTGMIYGGPCLPARIVGELSGIVAREGASSIRALRDTRLEQWEAKPL